MTDQDINAKAQIDAAKNSFKLKAKFEALNAAPTTRTEKYKSFKDSESFSEVRLSADEIKSGAETLYQWLIKDL